MGAVIKSKVVFMLGVFLGCLLVASISFATAAPGLTRSNSGGGVTVKVTYSNPQLTGETWFEVVLDTHSVNLDGYDLKVLSLLRDGSGKRYEPVKVENEGSGHHREFVLVFPSLPPDAKQLELVIKDIAGIRERTFRWDLK